MRRKLGSPERSALNRRLQLPVVFRRHLVQDLATEIEFIMESPHNAQRGWHPPWTYHGQPHAALVVMSWPDGIVATWHSGGDPACAEATRAFLAARLAGLPEMELTSEANFLYVVLGRPPRRTDKTDVVSATGAIAEFGYGSPPASPEEWPVLGVRDLVCSGLDFLSSRNRA